ncbi:MAG: S8 family peptidase [Bacilli bacterium]
MAEKRYYLLGKGELLTETVMMKSSWGGGKAFPYTFEESLERLVPEFKSVSTEVDKLSEKECPMDYAVETFTLHPSFIARSYYPSALFQVLELTPVGSRSVVVCPEKSTRKEGPKETETSQLFVAGKRKILRAIPDIINSFAPDSQEAKDVMKIECIGVHVPVLNSVTKIKEDSVNSYFEIALQLPHENDDAILTSFFSYANELSIVCFQDHSFLSGNLKFIPIMGSKTNVLKLAKFTFVRVLRVMPQLREFPVQFVRTMPPITVSLPPIEPITDDINVAILDGGLPSDNPITPWVSRYFKGDPDAEDDKKANFHGLAVSSAFLFGSLEPGEVKTHPYGTITHIRVIDRKTYEEDPLELYHTLGLIQDALLAHQYTFVNLSCGPDLPVDDRDVHAWTSVIDDCLADGQTFMTIAVGNNGDQDKESGNARIEVPSDCVNAVSVGASDSLGEDWERASYSAIGPGRRPGVIKPDLLAFGGSPKQYFHVLLPGKSPSITPVMGTSFAAPLLLRTAVCIRATLGGSISVLAIKALLIDGADRNKREQREVGWGRIPSDPISLITCPDGISRIIYQGDLVAGKYLRAWIPLPASVHGTVHLKATLCYATEVDAENSDNYTEAGLDITFRPDISKTNKAGDVALTKSFFTNKLYEPENELRNDFWKWETVMCGEKSFRSTTLNRPCFYIHYNARENGMSVYKKKIGYALVLTIETREIADITKKILDSYPQLIPVQPRIITSISTTKI